MTFDPRPTDLRAFGSALRAARQSAKDGSGITLDQLAAATGISKPYLSNIETARTPGPPSEEKLRRIARALNLDAPALLAAADWLRTPPSIRRAFLTGEMHAPTSAVPRRTDGTIDLDRLIATRPATDEASSPCLPVSLSPSPGTPTPAPELPLTQVPLINRVAAGRAGEFGDLSYPAGVADRYIATPDLPDAPAAALFAVRVIGDSMLPEYREGEILVVGPAKEGELHDGDDCVVRLGELENFATTFKRVFYIKDTAGQATAARLVPLNPAHHERTVKLEDITGIYPLVYRLVPGRASARPPAAKASAKLRATND